MKISIIGSGWLSLPLAHSLSNKGHSLSVSCTSDEKHRLLQSQGHDAQVYRLGDPLSDNLMQADVVVIAVTCKDLDAFKQLIHTWPANHRPLVVYTSSTAVYSENGSSHDENSQQLNVEHPTYCIEQILKPLNPCIIRLAGLVGPSPVGQPRHPGRFFKNGLIKNADNPVNLVHLLDALGIIEAAIEQNIKSEIFNACADNHPSKGKYYSQMALQLNGRILKPRPEQDSFGKTINNDKVKQVLKYKLQQPDVWEMTF